MFISLINHAKNVIEDEDLHSIIRAINRQIKHDFEPYWSMGAIVRLEGKSLDLNHDDDLGKIYPMDMRGDAILYLWDKTTPSSAIGFHEKHFHGIPYGVVYTEMCDRLKENYSVAISHEILELIADANVNCFAMGPHPNPEEDGRKVFHWFEVCDAVQAEQYVIDEVEVSNFVLPLYYTESEEKGSRNDFLCRKNDGQILQSFSVKKGGYIGFFDPQLKRTIKYLLPNDIEAKRRMDIKSDAEGTRRALRYQRFDAPNAIEAKRRMDIKSHAEGTRRTLRYQRIDADRPKVRYAKQDNPGKTI